MTTKERDSIEADDQATLSNEKSKIDLNRLINEGTTRRLKFTGTNRGRGETDGMTFQDRYRDYVSPIQENSGENENTIESLQN
eukprot:CAMPEP_0176339416 /NCGR_PEP_ID=MMETSP0126-20121128/746_1 /TAXON_ID=141414 ORGANISM="Strombidinopsis acuminatum, Strain SPMC142" /NCGR_SAMPLE_ID=MMETSP0126 /ASSEMBLY_ACC=CAM_ASM_000229 /LENGTH=82 /DNA_ID=CAMNT_0017682991 /DNA_START=754 /DNA_END=1005 /DNA_ORIENTATION=+